MHEQLSKAKLTKLRRLTRRKGRDAEGMFLAEGVRIIEELIRHRVIIDHLVLIDERTDKRNAETYLRRAAVIAKISAEKFILPYEQYREFSDTQSSQGIIAVCRKPKSKPDEADRSLLVLDNIRDPGNLGACLRSAAAFGVKQVSLVSGCADPWSPKVVRASMGGLFAMDAVWQEGAEAALKRAKTRPSVLALDAKPGLTSYFEKVNAAEGAIALVCGGETEGLSKEWSDPGVTPVSIPQADDIDSLNAAMATTLACNALWQRKNA